MQKQKPGALTGVNVLDLSRLLPGPYCSMILADHGARVIAVEDKRFLADGLFFNLINRNKEHMSLNLKTEKGKEIFFRLVQDADVVLEGFRPGVVDRLGVDYKTVRKVNPAIVYCSITGYGQDGPFRSTRRIISTQFSRIHHSETTGCESGADSCRCACFSEVRRIFPSRDIHLFRRWPDADGSPDRTVW